MERLIKVTLALGTERAGWWVRGRGTAAPTVPIPLPLPPETRGAGTAAGGIAGQEGKAAGREPQGAEGAAGAQRGDRGAGGQH